MNVFRRIFGKKEKSYEWKIEQKQPEVKRIEPKQEKVDVLSEEMDAGLKLHYENVQLKPASSPPKTRPREQDRYWMTDNFGTLQGDEEEEHHFRAKRVRRVYGGSGKSNYGY